MEINKKISILGMELKLMEEVKEEVCTLLDREEYEDGTYMLYPTNEVSSWTDTITTQVYMDEKKKHSFIFTFYEDEDEKFESKTPEDLLEWFDVEDIVNDNIENKDGYTIGFSKVIGTTPDCTIITDECCCLSDYEYYCNKSNQLSYKYTIINSKTCVQSKMLY